MGVGNSEQYADGRTSRQAQQQLAPTSPAPTDPPQGTQAPKAQHGGSSRQEGVKGGVAGAKYGKGLPPGMAAQRRGANWGLPNAQGRSFGVTRPIRVICLAGRLALLSDRRDSPRPQEIPLSPAMTPQEVDALVRAIQKQMEEWGLAAENGYWKPVLHVEVAGDADARYEELRAALQGSGIDVQRKLR
jgi:hypothetical protein